MPEQYKMVAENPQSTVVSDFEPIYRKSTQYQSEAEMERDFIAQLEKQGYEYLPIKTETELIDNLRRQFERLNDYKFTDTEWQSFFADKIANRNYGIVEKTAIIQEDYGIVEKTAIIQEDYIQLLTRDDGTVKNIYLIDKDHIHNNSLQVINQYTPEGGVRENRYDVTILVNGLPLVHVELKRRGVDIKEAFNQISRYKSSATARRQSITATPPVPRT